MQEIFQINAFAKRAFLAELARVYGSRPSIFPSAVHSLAFRLFKKINVCAGHQRRLRNVESSEQFRSDSASIFSGFAVAQNDLDLKESAEACDVIQMNSRSVHH